MQKYYDKFKITKFTIRFHARSNYVQQILYEMQKIEKRLSFISMS